MTSSTSQVSYRYVKECYFSLWLFVSVFYLLGGVDGHLKLYLAWFVISFLCVLLSKFWALKAERALVYPILYAVCCAFIFSLFHLQQIILVATLVMGALLLLAGVLFFIGCVVIIVKYWDLLMSDDDEADGGK